jgi:2-polyprenyl-3-methyl-5-hydroxy-6-metoxy-1,4-benzoquinol methylase
MTPSESTPIDEARLGELLQRVVADQGATMQAPLIVLGEQLGLYRALAEADEPLASLELAELTGTAERYVREWLRAQAAGGYVTYHAGIDRYSLSPEQAFILADENSPAFVVGGFQSALAAGKIAPRLVEAFRTGKGIGWHEHDHALFCGTERTFRAGYAANLPSSWIPALDGMEERLKAGARVADVGCGHGASTIIMAQAFPRSRFVGYDYHEVSIREARQRAAAAGVSGRVRFEVASAKSYNDAGYDLITMFDCLHDLGDPVGAAAHARSMMRPDGILMIVEPRAEDRFEDNLRNPVSRIFYSASTLMCVPNALSQDNGMALGAQAGEARIREVVTQAGFSRFRRVAETPFNQVYEAHS